MWCHFHFCIRKFNKRKPVQGIIIPVLSLAVVLHPQVTFSSTLFMIWFRFTLPALSLSAFDQTLPSEILFPRSSPWLPAWIWVFFPFLKKSRQAGRQWQEPFTPHIPPLFLCLMSFQGSLQFFHWTRLCHLVFQTGSKRTRITKRAKDFSP